MRHSRRTASRLWELLGAVSWPRTAAQLWITGLAAGALPLIAAYAFGFPQQQVLTAVLVFVPFLALVRDDRMSRGLWLIGLTYGAHSLVAIVLALLDPEAAARLMPGAQSYWHKQETWILTGVDPEYDPANWLPAHLQLLVGVSVYSFTSLGLLPLFEGLKEVDLMNFYVGQLAAMSRNPALAILLGWHLWSILRGLAYVFLVYEVSSLSLERLCGRPLSSRRRRLNRWAVGLSLFFCDCGLKFLALDGIRNQLFSNLAG